MKMLAFYWTMMTMLPISFAFGAMLFAMTFEPNPESQAFLDCGTSLPRYGDGSDLICRPDGDLVAAMPSEGFGWGAVLGTCEVDCECYCGGEFQGRQSGCLVFVYPFDANGDGVVDLEDYAEFQRFFGQ
jgi:hypothetical protein